MHTIDDFLRLIEKKGTTKSHRMFRTRVYVAVSIIVGQTLREFCSVNTHKCSGYDMDFEGTFYASNIFVRDLAWALTQPNNAPEGTKC